MGITLGKRIKQAMESKHMTQKELAEKACITPVTISRYINDLRTPDAMTLKTICKALDVSPEWVLGISDEGKPEGVDDQNEKYFDYAKFLQANCSYEAAVSEEVTKSIMGKVYTAAFNSGFQEGYIKGFTRAKEAYNKAEAAGE